MEVLVALFPICYLNCATQFYYAAPIWQHTDVSEKPGAGKANRTPDPNLGNGLVCLRTFQKRNPIQPQPPYSQALATGHSLRAPTNQQSHAPALYPGPVARSAQVPAAGSVGDDEE